MLKIKDNVDLKELEKFGFKYDSEFDVGMYIKSKHYEKEINDPIYGKSKELFSDRIVVFKDDRKIITDNYSLQTKMDYDTLFDLIQAGLVEKVENRNKGE